MLSETEIKEALARGETVLMGGKKITHIEQIVKPSMPQNPTEPDEKEEIGWLVSELEQVKQNQSDVTKLSSVQNLLSSYDKKISGIVADISINDLTIYFENKLAG